MEKFDSSDSALAYAERELSRWGLSEKGWTANLLAGRGFLGKCRHTNRTISINEHHIEYDLKEHVIDTILHEIAHALHYHHYADNGRVREYLKKNLRTGRRLVPPHGKEWKQFARLVGCNPSRTGKSVIREKVKALWTMVILHDDGNIEPYTTYGRFASCLKNAWIRGRKAETVGRLYAVETAMLDRVIAGSMPVNNLRMYQENPNVGYSSGKTVKPKSSSIILGNK